MNLLAIDTSTECASVAIMRNNTILGEQQATQREHARLILPMVEKMLAATELCLSQLDGIVYGRGPGSFTGLRIACSVAKGLAYAHDLPLYPVSSLAAIANELLHLEDNVKETAVLAVIDARMQQLYWAYFTNPLSEAIEQVSAAGDICVPEDKPLLLAGVGYEHYLALLPFAIQKKMVKHCCIYPKAEALICLAATGKITAVNAAEAVPVYVRNQITQGEARG